MLTPKLVVKRWWIPLPLGRFAALTIYPFIFVRRKGIDRTIVRHEMIHIWQVRKTGWLWFYLGYIWKSTHTKYHNLPVEIEAYDNQTNAQYLPRQLEQCVDLLMHEYWASQGEPK